MSNPSDQPDESEQSSLYFPPEEEAAHLAESADLKTKANALFVSQSYTQALETYDSALATCPSYLPSPRAILFSNIAACHLKLREWKEAARSAGDALDCIDECLGLKKKTAAGGKDAEEGEKSPAEDISPAPERAEDAEMRKRDEKELAPIRIKALMRRATARWELGGWQDLAGAEEDYKSVVALEGVKDADRRVARRRLVEVKPLIETAKEKEMGEMWGKLKDLGNGLLKPFGMSTDNFQMVKDQNTGGYSMNFRPNGSSS